MAWQGKSGAWVGRAIQGGVRPGNPGRGPARHGKAAFGPEIPGRAWVVSGKSWQAIARQGNPWRVEAQPGGKKIIHGRSRSGSVSLGGVRGGKSGHGKTMACAGLFRLRVTRQADSRPVKFLYGREIRGLSCQGKARRASAGEIHGGAEQRVSCQATAGLGGEIRGDAWQDNARDGMAVQRRVRPGNPWRGIQRPVTARLVGSGLRAENPGVASLVRVGAGRSSARKTSACRGQTRLRGEDPGLIRPCRACQGSARRGNSWQVSAGLPSARRGEVRESKSRLVDACRGEPGSGAARENMAWRGKARLRSPRQCVAERGKARVRAKKRERKQHVIRKNGARYASRVRAIPRDGGDRPVDVKIRGVSPRP